jgi:hypothetical protein
MKRMILTTAALAAVILLVPAASATCPDNTFTNGAADGKWSTPGNWSGGLPDADDNAVIPDDKVCNVDITDAVADTIEVQDGGTLNIETGMKLTLDGDCSPSKVSGDGKIYLEGSASELNFKKTDHAISYSGTAGEIIGQSADALITISTSNLDLTSSVTIKGALAITEDTSDEENPSSTQFVNSGTVNASTGMVDIDVDSISGAGLWQVSASGSAILKFEVTPSTTSDFSLSYGTLLIPSGVHISTIGDLVTFDHGATIMVEGDYFAFNQPS